MIIVNSWKRLTDLTKSSILGVAASVHPFSHIAAFCLRTLQHYVVTVGENDNVGNICSSYVFGLRIWDSL